MLVQVNGKQEDVGDGATIKTLLESKGINPNVVACELNLTIIKRAQLSDTVLKTGDALEIIQMIGGG
jgi:thiamine biosynthesis protein ThiS